MWWSKRDEPAEWRRCLVVEQRRARRGEDAALAPAVAKRNALAGLGNAVTVRAGQAFDQTAQAKTAQVIAGAAGSVQTRMMGEGRGSAAA